MTAELFQWSYKHRNENANNLIKGLERAEREGEKEGETPKRRKRKSEVEQVDEERRTEEDTTKREGEECGRRQGGQSEQ